MSPTAVLVVIVLGSVLVLIGLALVHHILRLGEVFEEAMRESRLEQKRLRRMLKVVAGTIPHCHECFLQRQKREDAKSEAERERERQEQGIVVVAAECPICRAPWEADVDREGQMKRMRAKLLGSECLNVHQAALFDAVLAKHGELKNVAEK